MANETYEMLKTDDCMRAARLIAGITHQGHIQYTVSSILKINGLGQCTYHAKHKSRLRLTC